MVLNFYKFFEEFMVLLKDESSVVYCNGLWLVDECIVYVKCFYCCCWKESGDMVIFVVGLMVMICSWSCYSFVSVVGNIVVDMVFKWL